MRPTILQMYELLLLTAGSSPRVLLSIVITPANQSVPAGLTVQMTATGHYSDGSTTDLTDSVTWDSVSHARVTVSNTAPNKGLATAVAAGAATTITATLGAVVGSTPWTTITATLISIAVSPLSPSVAKGLDQQMVATGAFTAGAPVDITTSVTWSSGSAHVTISNAGGSQGIATAVSTGTALLTATLAPGTPGSTTMTVTAPTLVSIAVTPANPSTAKGLTRQFTATGTYTDASTANITTSVTWASTDTGKATISNAGGSQGLATTIAEGATDISATLGLVSSSTTLTVSAPVLVSIAVTPANGTIPKGLFTQYAATGTLSDASTQDLTGTATWDTSDHAKATVNSSGVVTAVALGACNVTATLGLIGGSTGVTVVAPLLVSMAVTPQDAVLYSGNTQSYTATGTYTDGSTADVTASAAWSTSDANAFTVGASTGVATGTGFGVVVTVTATLSPASPATATLTCGAGWRYQSVGAGTAPLGSSFARASSGYTVRSGTSSVLSSGGFTSNDVPRIGKSVDANNPGLVFEHASTNNVKDSRNTTTANWQTGTVTETRPFGTAPDGSTTTATRTPTVSTGQFSRYYQLTGTGRQAISMWVQGNGSSQSAKWQVGSPLVAYTAVSSPAWQLQSGLFTASGGAYYNTPQQGTVCDIVHDMHQMEPGPVVTEHIVTTGSALTRAGEQWPASANLTSVGQLRLYFAGRPKESSANLPADAYLWHDATTGDFARVSSTTGAITFSVNSVTYTTAVAMSWAIDDYLEIFVSSGGSIATGAYYRVGGSGSWTQLSTGSPTAYGTIAQASTLDLLCNGTSGQFPGRWELVSPYRAGFTPVV